jgi:hypothetical protein
MAPASFLGVGTQSGQILPGRGAVAGAQRLGTKPVTFLGGHDGFLIDPTVFAPALGPGRLSFRTEQAERVAWTNRRTPGLRQRARS